MSLDTEALLRFVAAELGQRSDPDAAGAMAAYLKTEMPFYGVRAPQQHRITNGALKRFPLATRAEYRAAVLALWDQPHREEKYIAIGVARCHRDFVTVSSLPLYRKLIREGAWWDLVDPVAIKLVGRVARIQGDRAWPIIDRGIDDSDLWIRRSAIIAQIDHRDATDQARLFAYCRRRAHERDFFIRKAIGWALREYSYTDPRAVRDFLLTHRDELSGLSFREGAKGLRRHGLMD
jgi:3-methyladenine DNA glycosylase AlkD